MSDVDEFKIKKKEFKNMSQEISDELDKCEYTADPGINSFQFHLNKIAF